MHLRPKRNKFWPCGMKSMNSRKPFPKANDPTIVIKIRTTANLTTANPIGCPKNQRKTQRNHVGGKIFHGGGVAQALEASATDTAATKEKIAVEEHPSLQAT